MTLADSTHYCQCVKALPQCRSIRWIGPRLEAGTCTHSSQQVAERLLDCHYRTAQTISDRILVNSEFHPLLEGEHFESYFS